MRIALVVVIALSLLPAVIVGQGVAPSPTTERARFEAASVKPNRSGEVGIMRRPTPGRVFFANAPIDIIIEEAYGARPDRILNYPTWTRKETFDVTATYSAERQSQVPQMLQTLLEERFALRIHREAREMTVYELVKARADGRLGPGLRSSTTNCTPRADGRSPCTMMIAPGRIRTIGTPWGRGGSMLTTNIGVWDRPILDKTGLSGSFDMTLEWTPDPAQARSADGAREAAAVAAEPDERTSIFTALQEQLGLKLQPTRAPLEVIVIDRLERPTPD